MENQTQVAVAVAVAAAKADLFKALAAIKEAKQNRFSSSVAVLIAEREVWAAEEADSNIGNGVEYSLILDLEEARERLEKAEASLASAKSRAAALSEALKLENRRR